MQRHLPSLAALQCFEASARHLSFTRAAKELHITQSAVSRQIRSLEEQLGIRLFDRSAQGLRLSSDGASYLPAIRAALDKMESATLQLLANQGTAGVLNIAVLPTFGTRWLIPRLPAFRARAPDITVNILTKLEPFDLDAENIDLAISYGEQPWPHAVSYPLMGEAIAPVCSPDLLKRPPALKRPTDLRNHTLLQMATRPGAWKVWFDGIGLSGANAFRGPAFEHFSMVVQAAIAGLGIAVVPLFLVSEELANGRLVMPFNQPVESPHRYYAVCSEARQGTHRIREFRDWLCAEAARFERAGA